MIDDKPGQDVRICGAPGCDNPIKGDGRCLYCSSVCTETMKKLRYQQRLVREIKKRRAGRVCALEGCNDPVIPPRRRYSSDACAAKAQREQVRRSNEKLPDSRQGSSKFKYERHGREVRTIRFMQHVPAERWQEYEFSKPEDQ